MNTHTTPRLAALRVESPLGLFSVLWAIGSALHTLEDQPLDGLLTYPLVFVLLLNPERVWAIATFAIGHALILSLQLPDAANHSVLALLVDACLVAGCVRVWWRREHDALASRTLWDAVQGPLKAILVVVYFFAVFHKLNTSFFDPAVSCAVSQPLKMLTLHGFHGLHETSPFAFNIYFTLVMEAAIVVLLCRGQTVHVGALLGLFFHVGLGWARFYDFATVAFALYLFFFSWSDISERLTKIRGWVAANFLVCCAALALTSVVFYGVRGDPVIVHGSRWSFTADTLICLFWTAAVVPLLLPIYRAPLHVPSESRWSGLAIAWIFPVIAFVNGATSYLGLKTVANYSMFSNLRTEGGETNHFLVPAGALFLADYQNDLVTVKTYRRSRMGEWPFWTRFTGDGSPRWRSEMPGARVPMFELRRVVQEWKSLGVHNAEITYERGGQEFAVANAFADTALMRPVNPLARKLMAFRAVASDHQPSICRW